MHITFTFNPRANKPTNVFPVSGQTVVVVRRGPRYILL
jgi:hypothetical protein